MNRQKFIRRIISDALFLLKDCSNEIQKNDKLGIEYSKSKWKKINENFDQIQLAAEKVKLQVFKSEIRNCLYFKFINE